MQKHKKKKEMIEMLLKKGIFGTAAVLTACCFLSLGVSAAGKMTGKVTTKTSPLTVRASASTEAQKLGSLARGSTVTLISRNGDWWHVEYEAGRTGYCHAGYITVLEDAGRHTAVSLAVPDYKQYDSRWAGVLVGGSGQTMKRIGCTTSALADTESYRTGSAITPAQMENKLTYTKGGAVYWPDHYQSDTSSDYLSVILQNLKNGKPTIVGAKNSSGKAHWVVVTGYDGGEKLRASGFSINDPGSGSRSRLSDLFADYPNFYKLEYY